MDIYDEIAERRKQMARVRRVFWSALAGTGILGVLVCSVIFWLRIGRFGLPELSVTEMAVLLGVVLAGMGLLLVGLISVLRAPPPAPLPEKRPGDEPPVFGLLALAFFLPTSLIGMPGLGGALLYGATSLDWLGRALDWFYEDLPALAGGWWPLFAVAQSACFVGIVYWYLLRRGHLDAALTAWRGLPARMALLGVAAGALLWLLAALVERIAITAAPALFAGWANIQFDSSVGWWLALLASVVAAPFAEETFFRGYVLQKWMASRGRGTALAASSALFAVLHLNPVAVPAIFFTGLALALLTLRTGRLAPAILAHATFNLLSLLTLRGV